MLVTKTSILDDPSPGQHWVWLNTFRLLNSKHCAGSSGDSATEVVAVTRQPQEEHCFPGLYATSLPDQLFQTSELALLTSQWRNTAQVVAVDIERGTANKWASSAGAQDSTSRGSCAVLSSYNGEIWY